MQVLNPESGLPFTPAGAWAFAADLLESQHPIAEVALRKPAGCMAYVMKADGGQRRPLIYIKLELRGDHVHGRSFHYDEPECDDEPQGA